MFTVSCNYFATGEGVTHMVLYTRGYGADADPAKNAIDAFERHFGSYFARGAEVREGLDFDFNGAKLLVSDHLRTKLQDWIKHAGGLEYHASIHVNFS